MIYTAKMARKDYEDGHKFSITVLTILERIKWCSSKETSIEITTQLTDLDIESLKKIGYKVFLERAPGTSTSKVSLYKISW